MKKYLILLILVLVVWACSSPKPDTKFSYSPEKPGAGDELEIIYYPMDENLINTKVTVAVYFFNNDYPVVYDKLMEEKEGIYTTKMEVPVGYKGALVKFEYSDEIDNNNGLGFVVKLADENGAIYEDIEVATVFAKAIWGRRNLDLKSDAENALNFVSQEFHSGKADKGDYLKAYFNLLRQAERNTAIMVIEDEITNRKGNADLTKHELETMLSFNKNMEIGQDLSALEAKLKELDPQNAHFYSGEIEKIGKMEDTRAIFDAAESFLSRFAEEDAQLSLHRTATSRMYYIKDFKALENYVVKYPKAVSGGLMNAVAWNLAEQGKDLELAENFAKRGVDSYLHEIETLENKPDMITSREYKEGQKYSLGMVYDTYAYVLEQKGDLTQALAAYGNAVDNLNGEDPGVNERYVQALVTSANYQQAYDRISQFIQSGKSTPIMTDLLKQSYLKVKGSADGMDEYIAGLEGAAKAKMKEKLEKEIISEPAPGFTLKNIEGKDVSLADFKGKTVVVDFWATWCGPCRQSFPGMKTAVQKYQDVEFLFVNAWQNEKELNSFEAKRDNAKKFVEDNDYPFNVLIDAENSVIASFNVSGIPTKFIVDKNGNIRFKSVGFSGNADEMVDELGMMFDMIN
ncbi:MAG: hypothetical protein SCALA702_18430 [Melioribacteraceae bacterium]|nr:MAG: hypothetical protein SCALA702_18430 [Melioribacteraceae bacterium]